jgi:hypothetical protein
MCGYPIMASYHPIDLDDIPIMPLYYIGQGTTCFYPSWAILEENKVFFNCERFVGEGEKELSITLVHYLVMYIIS